MIDQHKHRLSIMIDLAKCDNPSQISRIMQQYKIRDYVYAFLWQGRVLKYGYSADQLGSYGERIYRQAGHMHGWPRRLVGSSGSDMRIISEEFQKKHGRNLDRNECEIWVLNMTRTPDDAADYDVKQTCVALERYMIDTCVDISGGAPIGNRDRDTQIRVVAGRNSQTLDRFFDFSS